MQHLRKLCPICLKKLMAMEAMSSGSITDPKMQIQREIHTEHSCKSNKKSSTIIEQVNYKV